MTIFLQALNGRSKSQQIKNILGGSLGKRKDLLKDEPPLEHLNTNYINSLLSFWGQGGMLCDRSELGFKCPFQLNQFYNSMILLLANSC